MRTNINQKMPDRKTKQQNNPLTKSDILKKECPSALTFNATEAGLHSNMGYKNLIVCDNSMILEHKGHHRAELVGNCLAYANADRTELSFEYLNIVDTSNFTGATIGRSGDEYNRSPLHPCDGIVLNKNIRSVDTLSPTQNIVLIDKNDYDPYTCIYLERNDVAILMNFKKNELCLKENNNTYTNNANDREILNHWGCRETDTSLHLYNRTNDEFLFSFRDADKGKAPILKTVNDNSIDIIDLLDCSQNIENKPINNPTHQNYMLFVLAPLAVAACLGIGIKRTAIRELIQNINQKGKPQNTRNQDIEIEMTSQII